MENVTSFRFYLAADTLAFSYALPTTGRTPDLHRLETCAIRRTMKQKPLRFFRRGFLFHGSFFLLFCFVFFCFLSSLC